MYLAVTDKRLRDAVNLLDESKSDKTLKLPEKQEGSATIVTVKAVYRSGDPGSRQPDYLTYFSHFVVSNEGKDPAVELEVAFLDGVKKLLEGRRETGLMIGERITWRPDVNRPDGQYYVVCQYKMPASATQSVRWNQTWLPFELTQSGRPGEVFVARGS